MDIKFDFDLRKFNALLNILSHQVKWLDILKAAKMFYLIDRECLLKTGRPVLGDRYICMSFGPVPSRAYDQMKYIRDGVIESPIQLDSSICSPGNHPTFKSTIGENWDFFSKNEQNCINEIIEKYRDIDGRSLIDLTHTHKAWTNTEQKSEIDYRLFFAEEKEKYIDSFNIMLFEQENRDFVDDL
ncbi:MAG: Panacea domain-containing protein [Candidatus Zixiibacteriota bacterium]